MPPKKKDEPPKLTRKQREALALKNALDRASDDARRNYSQQDKLRAQAERQARAQHDEERFDRAAEVKRLTEEMAAFRAVSDDIVVGRRLALLEHAKLTGWRDISECSPLPDPHSEPDIHRFLAAWREEQEGIADPIPPQAAHEAPNADRRVLIKRIEQPAGSKDPYVTGSVAAQRDDAPAGAAQRIRAMDHHVGTAHAAVQLVASIQAAADESLTRQKDQLTAMHVRHQVEINEAVLEAMDSITASALNYIDDFVDPNSGEECVLRTAPSADGKGVGGAGGASLASHNPAIKFGLWKKKRDRVTVGSIDYGELGILIEPKDQHTLKLPPALKVGLKDNIVIRAMQFSFDPFSVLTPTTVGQDFYALDCVLVLESFTHPDKPKRVAEWSVRVEAAGGPRELMRNPYPPRDDKGHRGGGGGGSTAAAAAADSDLMIKVTMDVPDTVALRAKHPTIGKWNPATCLWDPCSTGRVNTEGLNRRVTFLTSDLTALAIVQEKGFDVPYERWQIYPHSLDEVMVVLEGRNQSNAEAGGVGGGGHGSVELRILVREQECCLLGPEERELGHIRGRWLKPLTLLRLLSKAGYNFVLSDADAEFIPSVLPRTEALEIKAYFDISLFCMTHSFCSTRHNRVVEDPDMGLFRVSKEQRQPDEDAPFPVDTDDQGLWHSVRFEAERVVVAEFNEDEESPTLRGLPEHESHVNLYTVLQKIYGEEDTHYRATVANPLVQDCVFNLLRLTRPLTWG